MSFRSYFRAALFLPAALPAGALWASFSLQELGLWRSPIGIALMMLGAVVMVCGVPYFLLGLGLLFRVKGKSFDELVRLAVWVPLYAIPVLFGVWAIYGLIGIGEPVAFGYPLSPTWFLSMAMLVPPLLFIGYLSLGLAALGYRLLVRLGFLAHRG